MSRTVFLTIFILGYVVLTAQSDGSLSKGQSVRESMVKAFGGEKNVNKIRLIEYTALDISYHSDSSITTSTRYRLDLQRRFITATTRENGVTVVKAIDESGAWKRTNGEKEPLLPEEEEKLKHILFLNFLSILQNKDLQYEYVLVCQYKGHTADVVRITNPTQPSEQINLFVSKADGTILASSRQDPDKANQPISYADELEYKEIGRGIVFPHAYQVFVNGEMASEGRI
ncbi:hypothetical protein OB13_13705, partial [Pontibacter sp. HJ8]